MKFPPALALAAAVAAAFGGCSSEHKSADPAPVAQANNAAQSAGAAEAEELRRNVEATKHAMEQGRH